jgi:hypothetical protein
VHRRHALLVVLVSSAVAACNRGRPAWVLMHPPEVRDESYPKGHRLLTAAPVAEWRSVAAFDTEAACEAARQKNVDDSIDRARAEHGDDAKYDLTVRRAVHALCVTADPNRK